MGKKPWLLLFHMKKRSLSVSGRVFSPTIINKQELHCFTIVCDETIGELQKLVDNAPAILIPCITKQLNHKTLNLSPTNFFFLVSVQKPQKKTRLNLFHKASEVCSYMVHCCASSHQYLHVFRHLQQRGIGITVFCPPNIYSWVWNHAKKPECSQQTKV